MVICDNYLLQIIMKNKIFNKYSIIILNYLKNIIKIILILIDDIFVLKFRYFRFTITTTCYSLLWKTIILIFIQKIFSFINEDNYDFN